MKKRTKQITPSGEPWVWLTALGLSVGILMVASILGLIMYRGLEVFWPERAPLWSIRSGDDTLGTELVLGPEVLKQNKSAAHGPDAGTEIQIFQGNRESLGQAFRFISSSDIKAKTLPPEVIWIERMEYGKALGIPIALRLKDGTEIPFGAQNFLPNLDIKVTEAHERWEQIEDLEKNKIGKINREIKSIERKLKNLQGNETQQDNIASLVEKKSGLETQYEALANKARELRTLQDNPTLIYRLANGEQRELAVGQVVEYYFPNQLGFFDRLGMFWRHIGSFIVEAPREANTEGGVFPAIFGTLVMTVLMSLAVVPFGVLGAIYLSEYAKSGLALRLVRIAVNNLAGVPSIVFGVFGLGFFVYMVGGSIDSLFFSDRLPTPTFGTGGIFWASLTLALLTVPVVIVSTEEALASVPRGAREGALALGASKWQSIRRVILPAAAPGVLTGAILAMARGAGEVAPLMLVGVVKLAPSLPLDTTFPFVHLDRKFMHLGFHIFDLAFQSPDSEAAIPMVFATTLLLIALILVLNLGAILLRERLRKKYATGNF